MDWLLDPIKSSFSVVFFKVETTEVGVIMCVPQETCAEHEELQWFFYFVATSATVTEHETMFCLDIHNLRMEMMWKIQKNAVTRKEPSTNPIFKPTCYPWRTWPRQHPHKPMKHQCFGCFIIVSPGSKKIYPLDHQIRPSTLEQTLKAIRQKSFWAKKVFQVSTAYLPNSIKPLPSKCFRHTFRQLKAWLRD